MIKSLLITASVLVAGCEMQSELASLPAQNPAESVTPIFQDQSLFAVIENIDGDGLA